MEYLIQVHWKVHYVTQLYPEKAIRNVTVRCMLLGTPFSKSNHKNRKLSKIQFAFSNKILNLKYFMYIFNRRDEIGDAFGHFPYGH